MATAAATDIPEYYATNGNGYPTDTDRRGFDTMSFDFTEDRAERVLPRRIILVRHGESEGNVDESMYCRVPDPRIRLTSKGKRQARTAGEKLKALMEAEGEDYNVFFYMSPYRRSKETALEIAKCFPRDRITGIREEVQLREQDFGNFQDLKAKAAEKDERKRYGRFYYRFPNGESGADVFDRITIFEDHLVRDIDAGRFPANTNLVLITHGLTLRIFLSRWFHWTVKELEAVWNPLNSEPIVLERVAVDADDAEVCTISGDRCDTEGAHHTKSLYRLTPQAVERLQGCTPEMGGAPCPQVQTNFLRVLEHELQDEEQFEEDGMLNGYPIEFDECETLACERDNV